MSCDTDGPMLPDRRSVLAGGIALAASLACPTDADASVSFDIDRFGDKELKVAAINSIKQTCRNILSDRPDLLPAFFVLGLHDGLTYNVETTEGGPNGSLQFELDEARNAGLEEAVEILKEVKKARRDNMSLADVMEFACAVAVEVTAGPRIVIQLGREDATEADPQGNAALYTEGASASDMMKAFDSAGLNGKRDVVLMHGAYGSLFDIAKSRVEKKEAEALAQSELDDDEEGLAATDDLTYGTVKTRKRGAVLVSSNIADLTLGGAKFSNAYLKLLVDAKKKGNLAALSDRDREIMSSPDMLPFVEQYASNNNKFRTEVGQLCERVSLLGSQYESLKFAR